MKSLILGAALLASAFPALAQTNVSISVGQPGFFGRIDIGDYGPPPVMYAQPVIIQQRPHYQAAPVYLRVPDGHRKHWSRWCGRYNACGQRVLFVRDDWYTNTYVPRYQEHHRGENRDRHDGWERREHHEERRHEEHGRGHGDGHGHGRGHD
jgi:hypothetical protein